MNFYNNEQKKCGFCGESIPNGAGRCPYCGSILESPLENRSGMTPPEQPMVNPVEGAPQERQDQAQVEQNASVDINASGPQRPAEPQKSEEPYNIAPQRNEFGRQEQHENRTQGGAGQYGYNGYAPGNRHNYDARGPLGNGMKVFLTVLCTIIPGLGQLIGIIAAIVFMNAEGDSDRKSFGVALLVASLVMFLLSCIGCFILVIAFSSANQFNQFNY